MVPRLQGYLVGFPSGLRNWMQVVAAQPCECTKCPGTAHSKAVHFMLISPPLKKQAPLRNTPPPNPIRLGSGGCMGPSPRLTPRRLPPTISVSGTP